MTSCDFARKQERAAVLLHVHRKTCDIFLFRRQNPTLHEAGLQKDYEDSIKSFRTSFTRCSPNKSTRRTYRNQEISADAIVLINQQTLFKSHKLAHRCPFPDPGFYTAVSSHVSLASPKLYPKKFLFSRLWMGPRKVSFFKASQMHVPW